MTSLTIVSIILKRLVSLITTMTSLTFLSFISTVQIVVTIPVPIIVCCEIIRRLQIVTRVSESEKKTDGYHGILLTEYSRACSARGAMASCSTVEPASRLNKETTPISVSRNRVTSIFYTMWRGTNCIYRELVIFVIQFLLI